MLRTQCLFRPPCHTASSKPARCFSAFCLAWSFTTTTMYIAQYLTSVYTAYCVSLVATGSHVQSGRMALCLVRVRGPLLKSPDSRVQTRHAPTMRHRTMVVQVRTHSVVSRRTGLEMCDDDDDDYDDGVINLESQTLLLAPAITRSRKWLGGLGG